MKYSIAAPTSALAYMPISSLTFALTLALTFAPASTHAQDKVRVGYLSTLSGAQAGPGAEIRDGFNAALKTLGNRLGGQPVELFVADDQLNPEVGKQAAERLIKRDRVHVLTGLVYSNVLLAIAPVAFDNKVVLVSPNAGPSQLAGEGCNRYFFSSQWQNDVQNGAPGRLANERKLKSVYAIAPNYAAGRDAINGFKAAYQGKLVDEVYVKLGQLDYGAELAAIRAAKPDALYAFLPGGMGINFVKQFVAAGISREVQLLLPGFAADEDSFKAIGDALLGVPNTAHWAHDLDNNANRQFVAAFRAEYKRMPSVFAAQGWDTAMLLDGAVRETKGKFADTEALIRALRAKRYESIRGPFRWGNNNFPVQDWYTRVVMRDRDGNLTNRTLGKLATDVGDSFASRCTLKW